MSVSEFLTVREVAKLLQVAPVTVYGWLRTGELPAARLGRVWRIRRQDLEAFIESKRPAWAKGR